MIATLHLALSLALSLLASPDSAWVLERSTLTYHVSHPLHESEGVTHAARGKGRCHEGQCEFLIAVPVKSFDSGDSNRDLHMQQATRAAEFPLVTVRTSLPESAAASATIQADLEIEFAGQKAAFRQVALEQTNRDGVTRVTGTIPATLSAFRIEKPSLLGIPVKDEMPVRIEMEWRKQS